MDPVSRRILPLQPDIGTSSSAVYPSLYTDDPVGSTLILSNANFWQVLSYDGGLIASGSFSQQGNAGSGPTGTCVRAPESRSQLLAPVFR